MARGVEYVGSIVVEGPGVGGSGVDEMDGRAEKSIDGVWEGTHEGPYPVFCGHGEGGSPHGMNESAIAAASNETIGLKSVLPYSVLGRAVRSSMMGTNLLARSMASFMVTE